MRTSGAAGKIVAGLALVAALAVSGERPARPQPAAPEAGTFAASAATRLPADAEVARFFERYVAGEVRRLRIPGASLVVVRDRRVILSRGYGHADLATGKPVTPHATLIRQGSISKLLVWLLAMQLVEEGQLDLDRDVNFYLGFRVPERFGRPVTMRHLMTHTAGFEESMGAGIPPSLGEALAAGIPRRVYPPGTTVAYSNYGAALAAHVVERLRRRPFDRLAEERIFRPLGMNRSSLADPLPKALRASLASGYGAGAWEPFPFEPIGELLRPVGGLAASGEDMGRLVAMLLASGATRSGSIVAPDTLRAMLEVRKPLGPGLRTGLGLGFIVGEHRGVRYAGHGGTHNGGASDLELLPDHGLGWSIAFNGRGENGAAVEARGALLKAVIERFLASGPVGVRARGASAATAAAGAYLSTRRPHSGPASAFAALGLMTATANPDGSLTTEREGSVLRWLPDGPDRFLDSETGIPLAVTRNAGGTAVRLASPLLNNVAEFERAPLAARVAIPVLAIGLPVLLVAGIARAIASFRRRRDERPAPERGVRRIAAALAQTTPWLVVAAVLAWLVGLMTGLLGAPGVLAALYLLSLLALAGVAVSVFEAAAGALEPSVSLPRRLGRALVALCAAGTACLLIAFDMTIF